MKDRVLCSILALTVMFCMLPWICVQKVEAQGDTFATISAGASYYMVITSDKSLWAWGHNTHGQVGDGGAPNSRPLPIKIMDSVSSVSAGHSTTMVIKTDGSLWAWGNNWYGQLGDGTVSSIDTTKNAINNNDKYNPIKILDSVSAVSAGNSHTVAVKKDGSLWACAQLILSVPSKPLDFIGYSRL